MSAKTFLTGLLSLLLIAAAAQSTEYIQTDSSLIMGANVNVIVRLPSNNSQFIDVVIQNDTVTYTPDDIKEYGSRYGIIYVSKEITISGTSKKVFLEQLDKGKVTLFYYREKGLEAFFIEKTTNTVIELVQVTKKERREILADLLRDCEWTSDPIKIVKYTKKSLTKLIFHYNHCQQRPFSYLKFGIAVGVGFTDMTVSSKFGLALRNTPISSATQEIRATTLVAEIAPMIGVFVDIPLSVIDLSLITGIYLSKNDFDVTTAASNRILIEITTVDIPIFLRYTFPKKNLRPFVNFGPVFSYHIANSNGVFRATDNTANFSFVSDNLFGLSLGSGLVRNLDHRKTISLELRMSKFFGDTRSLGKSQANLILGFTI